MIPLKDQDAIRVKFAAELLGQVKIDYFTERELGLTVPGKLPCQYCKPTREMLQELAGLSDLLSLRVHYFEDNPPEKAKFGVERVPATVLRGALRGPDGTQTFVKFYGMPGGTEFPGFLECLVDISRGEVLLSPESVESLQSLATDVSVKVFVTPTCPYCPQMMRVAYQMAMASPHVRAETIEVNEFPDLADRYRVQAVPLTVINDSLAIPGAVHERDLVAQVMQLVGPAGKADGAPEGPTSAAEKQPPRPIERGKERPSGLFIP